MIIIIIIIIVVLVARTAGFAVYKNTHFYVYGVVWQTGGENLVGPPPPHALIIPESEIVFWPAKIYNFVAAPNSICQRYRKVAKKMANFPNCVLCVFLFCFFFFWAAEKRFCLSRRTIRAVRNNPPWAEINNVYINCRAHLLKGYPSLRFRELCGWLENILLANCLNKRCEIMLAHRLSSISPGRFSIPLIRLLFISHVYFIIS